MIKTITRIRPCVKVKNVQSFEKLNFSKSLINKFSIRYNSNLIDNNNNNDNNDNNNNEIIETGQPIFENRPQLVKEGDLTTGISSLEYYKRRIQFAMNMKNDSIAILPSYSIKFSSGSVFYKFQQENDFFYLSGFNEPDSIIIIEKKGDGNNDENIKFHLIVPPRDLNIEKWEGFRTGIDGVIEIFNADIAISNKNFIDHLGKLLKNYKNVYYDLNESNNLTNTSLGNGGNSNLFSRVFGNTINTKDQNRLSIENLLRESNSNIYPIKPITINMRLRKSNSELKILQLAGKISSHALNKSIAKLPNMKSEKALNLYLDYKFQMLGCDNIAYIPVIASGKNALCIHYTRNDQLFNKDEMVLIDAAGKLGGYCADISRTYPISGKFSNSQKELYQSVLNVEKKCIELCTVSSGYSLHDLHYESVRLMTKELRNCGFNHLQDWEVMKFLYPHYIGHNLGLDLHDLPNASRNQIFQKGQVITVEPGVYVPNDPKWPKSFRNIGIRIEDDIAIGDLNYVNLTKDCVKEINDIEKIASDGEFISDLDDENISISKML